MSAIDEKLLALTTENEQLKATIADLNTRIEELQIDYTNKLAVKQVEFETKELGYKRQIRELTASLELRGRVEEDIENRKKRKSVKELYEEALRD